MSQSTKVLYNADCPVCSLEINHYIKYSQDRALEIDFDDLNSCDLARWGLTADDAAKRLYVLQNGALLDGMPAFLALWSEMPRYRLLGRLCGLPIIRPVTEKLYDKVAAPLIYKWHLRRLAKRAL